MFDPRRYLGTGAVLALVLLRLVVGWHFFTEGTKKFDYDARTGQFRLTFTAGPFLSQAKGPLAEFFHSQAPRTHDWPKHLAVPRENAPISPADADERKRWLADYQRRRAEAEKSNSPMPVAVPPFAPYHDWAQRIEADWRTMLDRVTAIAGLTEEQKKAMEDAFRRRYQELTDYLAGESEAIADYQHQLWRLANWRASPEAGGVPFENERIAKKLAETTQSAKAWIDQVEQLDAAYVADLQQIVASEQRASANTTAAMNDAVTPPGAKWLHTVNLVVTMLTIGVGICLLLGLFTRLAAIVGALFLLSVIVTQPPWLPDAEPTIAQAVELCALLVLAGTRAGRWFGLDFFTYAVFGRSHGAPG